MAGFAAGIFLMDRALLWMERRGWILYRAMRPGSGTVGPAFLEVQKLFEPGAGHVVEEMKQQRAEEDDEGGPDKAGEDRRRRGAARGGDDGRQSDSLHR